MEITSAEFVISNTDVKKCPAGIFPEYAFIGRSNVGKSSLINMLTSRKGLAMTSSTPGKTMLINHFLINKNWYLVDLPGRLLPIRNPSLVLFQGSNNIHLLKLNSGNKVSAPHDALQAYHRVG